MVLIQLESWAAFASVFRLNCFLFGLFRIFIQTNFSLLFVLEVNWLTQPVCNKVRVYPDPALFLSDRENNYSFRILNHWWSLSLPSNYLDKGPNVVNQGSGKKEIDDDQHYKTEHVQSQAAEFIILFIFEN